MSLFYQPHIQYLKYVKISKKLTYEFFENIINVPIIFNENDNLIYPVFVKPDKGCGSNGVKKINNYQSLIEHCNVINEPLILEYLPGKEYTIDCFSDRNKGLIFVGIRERIRVTNGICTATKRITDMPEIEDIAFKIYSKIPLFGSWFFQIKYSKNNKPYLLEIAPRIAGCMGFYRGLGINFPLLSIYEFERKPIEILLNDNLPNDLKMTKIYRNYYHNSINYKYVYVDLDDTLIYDNNVNDQLIQFLYQCSNKNIKCFLITRNNNSHSLLKKHKISLELFDKIIHVDNNKKKSEFIEYLDSIFIDDSFKERKDVKETKQNVYVMDCSSLDLLLNIKK